MNLDRTPKACGPLSRLSLDIVSLIVPYLHTRDIKAGRLVGWDFHFFLTPYLFRSITFAPYQQSLDILEGIAQNPILSHNTKTLYFDCTVFRLPTEVDKLDTREFLPTFNPDFGGYQGSWIFSSKSLHHTDDCIKQAQHAVNYSKFAFDSMTIRNDLEAYLCSVLNSFPKITNIILTNTFTTDTSNFKYALQESTVGRYWIRPPQLIALFRAISKSTQSKITRIDTEGRVVQKKWKLLGSDSYGGDDNRVGTARHSIRNFESATYRKEKKPTIISSSFDMNLEDLKLTLSIFSNLTDLNLTLATTQPLAKFDTIRTTPVTERCWAGLPTILSALQNIINLSLDFKVHRQLDSQLSVYYYEDDLGELFEKQLVTLPHLRTLSLAQFRTSVETLTSFIERHSTIINLTLKHVIQIEKPNIFNYSYDLTTVSRPGWAQFLEVLKEKRLMRLNLVNVEGFRNHCTLPGAEHCDLLYPRIHDYVLHQYGDNPLSDECYTEDWDEELLAWVHYAYPFKVPMRCEPNLLYSKPVGS